MIFARCYLTAPVKQTTHGKIGKLAAVVMLTELGLTPTAILLSPAPSVSEVLLFTEESFDQAQGKHQCCVFSLPASGPCSSCLEQMLISKQRVDYVSAARS